MIYYEINEHGLFTGVIHNVEPGQGRKMNWVSSEPPEIPAGQVAQWRGTHWALLDDQELTPTIKARKRAAALREVAAKRYDQEVKGINLNGMHISTDDRSKSLLTGKFNRAQVALQQQDTEWRAKWKAGDMWVELSAEQIIGIGLVVDSYIQACFDREGEIAMAIENDESYNINDGWPSTEISVDL